MHHAQRSGCCEFNGKVAVADAIQAVLAHTSLALLIDHAQTDGHALAVKRISGASQCGRTQGQAVGAATHIGHAFSITRKHFDISQQMMGKAHGLRHLQMREAWQDNFHIALSHFNQ